VSADGSLAVLVGADPDTVRVVQLGGGAGQAAPRARAEVTVELVAMREVPSTGEWSDFADATTKITLDEPGRRLLVDVDGQQVLDAEAPWWSDPMPDRLARHEHGACIDESVEIMQAWIAPAQRRALLVVDVDFTECQHSGGFYLVGW
jgi:hypothetical protein